jgi:hypothetical protein
MAAASDIVNQFFQMSKAFMMTFSQVFHDCDYTQSALAKLQLIEATESHELKEQLINKWYEIMSPHVQGCIRKDEAIILHTDAVNSVLSDLNIRTKWRDPDFDTESKDVMWEYINNLNSLAVTYHNTTPEQQQALHSLTRSLMEDADLKTDEDGRISFSADIFTKLISKVSEGGELNGLVQGLGQQLASGVSNPLMDMLQGQMGNMQGLLGAAMAAQNAAGSQ